MEIEANSTVDNKRYTLRRLSAGRLPFGF